MQLLRPLCTLAVALALSPFASRAARGADLPPITDAERAITSVPGEPNAQAVVLFKRGEFLMAGFGQKSSVSLSSSLHIQVRLKILTEEGKSNGEVSIAHSDFQRLRHFQGRTILPDGRILPVAADAKFVRKTSRSLKTFTTAVAFPAVQVGAILEYEYELWFDSIFYLEPWYFSEEIPVRYSEITFRTAPTVAAQAWSRGPATVLIQRQTDRTSNGYITRAWAENIPSVPDDAYGPPYQDLAAQMLLLPTAINTSYVHETLLESWPKTCELIGKYYDQARDHDRGVAGAARSLAAAGSPRDKARALFRFVRDQIEDDGYIGVLADPKRGLDEVLEEHKGDRAEKALLLQAMLAAVKIDSRLVWAADRDRGAIDPTLPNPHWFDTVLVRVELDGQKVYLDPSDRTLGFGRLRAGYEGTPALVYDPKKPEGIVLPETPYDQNLEHAEVDLALDAQGRLAGTGVLRLSGQRALQKLGAQDAAKATQEWKEWLDKRFRDFQVADVKTVESLDDGTLDLTWSLTQREEEVLGDEVALIPSAPLGPLAQPFVQPVSSRRSGVVFDFPYRQEVELRLRWPEGWKLESVPREKNLAGKAGLLAASVEAKPAERTLVFKRRLDVTQRRLDTSQDYDAARSLFAEVEKNDAQKLALVHR
jgi:transglutaminase-like putative cysteine protease